MNLWKFLHVLSMFSAVTLLVGSDLFAHLVIRSHDVRAIRAIAAPLRKLENVGIALVVAGVVFGIVTALDGGFDLAEGWLIVAYVLVGALFVLGPIESALLRRVFEAAEASPTDDRSAHLVAAIGDRRLRVLLWVSIGIYVGVIFDMVVKPID